MFCEPAEEPVVEEVTESNADKNRLIVSIRKDADPNEVIHHLKKMVEKNVRLPKENVSHARFTPSKPAKNLMPEKLERYRLVYELYLKGFKRYVIADELQGIRSKYKNTRENERQYLYGIAKTGKDKGLPKLADDREISRDLQKARLILKNVAKGQFP